MYNLYIASTAASDKLVTCYQCTSCRLRGQSGLRKGQKLLVLLQELFHHWPDDVGLVPGEGVQHSTLSVKVAKRPRSFLIHVKSVLHRLRFVVVALDQVLARHVVFARYFWVVETGVVNAATGGVSPARSESILSQ